MSADDPSSVIAILQYQAESGRSEREIWQQLVVMPVYSDRWDGIKSFVGWLKRKQEARSKLERKAVDRRVEEMKRKLNFTLWNRDVSEDGVRLLSEMLKSWDGVSDLFNPDGKLLVTADQMSIAIKRHELLADLATDQQSNGKGVRELLSSLVARANELYPPRSGCLPGNIPFVDEEVRSHVASLSYLRHFQPVLFGNQGIRMRQQSHDVLKAHAVEERRTCSLSIAREAGIDAPVRFLTYLVRPINQRSQHFAFPPTDHQNITVSPHYRLSSNTPETYSIPVLEEAIRLYFELGWGLTQEQVAVAILDSEFNMNDFGLEGFNEALEYVTQYTFTHIMDVRPVMLRLRSDTTRFSISAAQAVLVRKSAKNDCAAIALQRLTMSASELSAHDDDTARAVLQRLLMVEGLTCESLVRYNALCRLQGTYVTKWSLGVKQPQKIMSKLVFLQLIGVSDLFQQRTSVREYRVNLLENSAGRLLGVAPTDTWRSPQAFPVLKSSECFNRILLVLKAEFGSTLSFSQARDAVGANKDVGLRLWRMYLEDLPFGSTLPDTFERFKLGVITVVDWLHGEEMKAGRAATTFGPDEVSLIFWYQSTYGTIGGCARVLSPVLNRTPKSIASFILSNKHIFFPAISASPSSSAEVHLLDPDLVEAEHDIEPEEAVMDLSAEELDRDRDDMLDSTHDHELDHDVDHEQDNYGGGQDYDCGNDYERRRQYEDEMEL